MQIDKPKQVTLIPKAPLMRIFKKQGTERVSDRAVQLLVSFLTKNAEVIAANAVEIAKHRGSRTVNEGDVRLAAKSGPVVQW